MIAFFTVNEEKQKTNIIKETAPLWHQLMGGSVSDATLQGKPGKLDSLLFLDLWNKDESSDCLSPHHSNTMTSHPQGWPAKDKHHKLSQFVCDTQHLEWKHHGIKYRPEWRMQRNRKASRFKLHSLCAIRHMLKKTSIQCIIMVLKSQTQEEGKQYLKPEAFILFSIEIILKLWICKYTKRSKLYKNSLRKTIQDKVSQPRPTLGLFQGRVGGANLFTKS